MTRMVTRLFCTLLAGTVALAACSTRADVSAATDGSVQSATSSAGTTRTAQPDPAADARVKRVMDDPRVAQALSIVDRDHDRMIADIVTLTEIPSPPFKEDKRAAAYLAMLRGAGLTNVE